MTATISSGATTISPDVVDGYEAASESASIIHQHLDDSIGVTLRTDLPRSGRLQLVFSTEADAWAARDALATAKVWTFTHPTVASVGMSFVRTGEMRIAIDATRGAWLLEIGYQEVLT